MTERSRVKRLQAKGRQSGEASLEVRGQNQPEVTEHRRKDILYAALARNNVKLGWNGG